MVDTCQANTMYLRFYSPNILCVGLSRIDESSYSHHLDLDVGVAVIDRFTFYTLEFLEKLDRDSHTTMDKLFDEYTFANIHSHAGIRTDLYARDPATVRLTDFFGNVQEVVVRDVDYLLLAALPAHDLANTSNNFLHVLRTPISSSAYARNLLHHVTWKESQLITSVLVVVLGLIWAVIKE